MRATPSRRERTNAERFNQRYGEGRGDVGRAMAMDVFGANVDVNGYTTVAQAERLARALKLRPGMLLLDVGAGAGLECSCWMWALVPAGPDYILHE